jgi:D-alanine-D-alanine ligase
VVLFQLVLNMKIRVGVVFGGRSGEHEISKRSAKAVIEHIDASKYEVIPIAITDEGHWLGPGSSVGLLAQEAARLVDTSSSDVPGEIAVIGDPRHRGLRALGSDIHREVDVMFPVLHGTYGEDGTIQGLFEMADLPYVGCGVVASACGMDKAIMKALFKEAGLPICRHYTILRSRWESDTASVMAEVEAQIGYPCFVKPANLGSSVGISRADNSEELKAAIDLAAQYDRKVIVEEALKMREIECAVLGNDEPVASLPGEYVIKDKSKAFLDYTEKYAGTGNNEFVVPAPVSDELSNKIREMAIRAFKAVDGSGLARVDFFLRTDNGALLVNELNTMPGLTDASGYPKMWEGTGKPFSQVIEELIGLAIDRHRDKSRNKTSREV